MGLKNPSPTSKTAAYFEVGDIILYGKFKNKKGRIVGFGDDGKGNPTVEIEPVPKGTKQNKVLTLFKIRKNKEITASEALLISRVIARSSKV